MIKTDLTEEESAYLTLLAFFDISGGDTNAEIPFEEVRRYIEQNFDELVSRIRKWK